MNPRAKSSPTESFEDLYRQHATFVWRVVQRLGVREADAEDVTQEVFVVVYRKLESFAGQSSLRTWIYGIAYRCASEYRRRAHVRKEVATIAPDLGSEEAQQPALVDKARARKTLDRILGDLDDDKRAVFVFYEIEELEMGEVAEVMKCPVQTAYSRLRSARDHVQAAARRIAAQEVAR